MSDELMQLLSLAIVIIYEMYAVNGHDNTVYARFWDAVARIAGAIANFFANLAVNARLNYWETVNS